MDYRADFLAHFSAEADAPLLYLPDLTLWHSENRRRGTLPEEWREASLPEIARDLGAPAWQILQPWNVETPGVEVRTTEDDAERLTHIETPAGILSARWSLGPDGNWWQMEYPVKTAADLPAALQFAQARTYVLDDGAVAQLEEVEEHCIIAVEIPTRPYADLIYNLLGMSEGFILLHENPPALQDLVALLEDKLQSFVHQLAALPCQTFFAADNLDGQLISPPVFEEHLAVSYARTTEVLHQRGKHLLVHAGGPIGRLLPALAAAGVDGVEGLAGPPQGDTSLAQARQSAGPDITLWGGIPQDFLFAARSPEEFEDAVVQAARQARATPRIILGVADRVPADAEVERLRAIPSLIEGATRDEIGRA